MINTYSIFLDLLEIKYDSQNTILLIDSLKYYYQLLFHKHPFAHFRAILGNMGNITAITKKMGYKYFLSVTNILTNLYQTRYILFRYLTLSVLLISSQYVQSRA